MRAWIRGVTTLVLQPDVFFWEDQETRSSVDHAVTFLVFSAVLHGAIRYTLTPIYASTMDWFRPVMGSILVVPGMLYVVIITSLFAQAVLSHWFNRNQPDQDTGILSAYQRTLAVFCYVMIFPALLLWIPPLLPWTVPAVLAVFLIAIYTTYNALYGLSVYHSLPVLAAVCEQPGRIRERETPVQFLTAGLVLLLALQLVLIGVPGILL